MVRGIERRNIFDGDADRDHFLHRMGEILLDTGTTCFAWSLMPNHFHLLLRTGNVPVSTFMRRLLTGYAIWFNRSRKRRRHGHLFQNRFKSILCQEDAYLLELVRYIHLNPLRAGLVKGIEELDVYPYSGHGTFMGGLMKSWQETDEILKHFGNKPALARRRYRQFVEQGIGQGRRKDLTGGGLIRSAGGWEGLKQKREEGQYQRSDERILGDSDFVGEILDKSKESLTKSQKLKSKGMDVDKIASHVASLLGLAVDDVWAAGRQQHIVNARSLLCYWAVRELGVSMSSLSRRLGISLPAISKSVVRGKQIAEDNAFILT
jgi:REP element-mobilizing transposase RayT